MLQDLKKELHDIEYLHSKHEHLPQPQQRDPEKLMQHIKKMQVNVDLTQQRITKFESDNKQLKSK